MYKESVVTEKVFREKWENKKIAKKRKIVNFLTKEGAGRGLFVEIERAWF
jgi:hypothetical protein